MAKIIAGNSAKSLARTLSHYLGLEYLEAQLERFSDQELRVQLPLPLYQEDTIIVQSTSKPANDHLMELLLLVDAAKRAGAQRVIALMPYFGYSRQDRPSYEWGPISCRLVATLLEASGVDHLITLDLHSKQSEGFFKIAVQNIDPVPLFLESLDKSLDWVVVSPDVGGLIRAQKLAERLGTSVAIINKTRKTHNTCEMDHNIIGVVKGKNCILVDDILDTGSTICNAAFLLKKNGALSVQVMVTHAVLSGDALIKIEQAPIEKMMITESIPQNILPSNTHIIDIVPILGSAIRRTLDKVEYTKRENIKCGQLS